MQGQEARIVFISTVLSKPETLPPVVSGSNSDLHLGFWRNPRRFNVAITRAKALLVVLGHPSVLVEVGTHSDFCVDTVGKDSEHQHSMLVNMQSLFHNQILYPE